MIGDMVGGDMSTECGRRV